MQVLWDLIIFVPCAGYLVIKALLLSWRSFWKLSEALFKAISYSSRRYSWMQCPNCASCQDMTMVLLVKKYTFLLLALPPLSSCKPTYVIVFRCAGLLSCSAKWHCAVPGCKDRAISQFPRAWKHNFALSAVRTSSVSGRSLWFTSCSPLSEHSAPPIL